VWNQWCATHGGSSNHAAPSENGHGGKDRIVPFPAAFKEPLALHLDRRRHAGGDHLFESAWRKPYGTRGGVGAMLAHYAN